MPPVSIILAWKDAEYRKSLSNTEQVQLPDHSTGLVYLLDNDQEPATLALGTEHNTGWFVDSHAQ
jgi:mersacidin/lichenicidin family type 2 lantibiotic